jgi:hypothetical protein
MPCMGLNVDALDHDTIRLIALPDDFNFFSFSIFKPQFSLNDLQNTETPKLTKNIKK